VSSWVGAQEFKTVASVPECHYGLYDGREFIHTDNLTEAGKACLKRGSRAFAPGPSYCGKRGTLD
jgi:hypothetical protein